MDNNLVKFNGSLVAPAEAEFLQDIIHLTKINGRFYTIENNQVKKINLYNSGLKELPESIGNLTSLSYLNLIGNKLTSLPDSLFNCKSLQILDLSINRLVSVSRKIENLRGLTQLTLSKNKLELIPDSICNLRKLQRLGLGLAKSFQLPSWIGNLKSLRDLYLDFEGIPFFPKSVENLTLQALDIVTQNSSDIPESLKYFNSVQWLGIHVHNLTTLPPLSEFDSVESFELSSEIGTTLPLEVIMLKNLKVIYLLGSIGQVYISGFINDEQTEKIIRILLFNKVDISCQ